MRHNGAGNQKGSQRLSLEPETTDQRHLSPTISVGSMPARQRSVVGVAR